MEINILHPLIVPSRYYSKDAWDLPHYPFPNTDYILTWVFFRAGGSVSYITRDEYNNLNKNYTNWQQITFENLRKSLSKKECFISRFRKNPENKDLTFIIFANQDGIGSSRILLSYELSQAFPEGYQVGMPDRSYGVIVSAKINKHDLEIAEEVIKECYEQAPAFMSKKIMSPSELALPPAWLHPIDSDLSSDLVEEIESYKM